MITSTLRALCIVTVALAVGACASGGNKKSVDSRTTQGQGVDRPSTRPLNDFSGSDGRSLAEREAADAEARLQAALSQNIIYFALDDATLSSEGVAVVNAFAGYLQANPAARIRLEGHTDERGSREYNLGLGERRAKSVEAALLRAGVSSAQISVLSYGEERPTCADSSESCWANNRRVEIIRL